MATSSRSKFAHRHNLDGTYDSICKECFKTVATEGQEADLRTAENAHVCLGLNLSDVLHAPGQK